MESQKKRKLVLADGSEYIGLGFGSDKEAVCELVFNTSMASYQEILSDPSYTDQFIVMTYPLIGNYGINVDDFETERPTAGGLIVRDYNDLPSNFRSSMTLSELMIDYDIPGLSEVDTRTIARKVRDMGSMPAIITDIDTSSERAKELLAAYKYPVDGVSRVSRKTVERYHVVDAAYHVACVDFGMKENIVRSFLAAGCKVTVFPWNVSAETIRRCNPDGVFFSNGPGNPSDVTEAIELVRQLRGQYPMFGICLGHQIIALAYGAKTYKLKFGHRGGNHPVQNLSTGKIEMTSQNHSFAVDENSLSGTGLVITHKNLLDNTIEGLAHESEPTFSVQYHPESAPGPNDGSYLFGQFLKLMGDVKSGNYKPMRGED